jgi:voltage-gated potassium channel
MNLQQAIELYKTATRHLIRRASVLWPHWPLALALIFTGAINILIGARYNLPLLQRIKPLTTLGESLGSLGSNAQILLGVSLVLVGIGLLWRLRSAWAIAVLLLMITVAVNVFRSPQPINIAIPGVILILLIILRREFDNRVLLANYLISIISILFILTYGTLGAYLLGPGFKPNITNLTTGLYFTIITLSTVGYGDIIPMTTESRMFVLSLLVVGLSVFATVFASTLGPMISGELALIFNPKGKKLKLVDHVILVGEGAIAQNTADELIERKILFVQVIEQNGETPEHEYPVIRGDSTEDTVLKEAGIDKARLIIAARDDDVENAFISLAAKDLNPQIRVLAVAGSARSIRRMKLARADLVFAPVAVGSRLMANLVEGSSIPVEFQDLLKGRPQSS